MHGYRCKLYISGRTPRTERAIANLRRIGEHHLGQDYELEVIEGADDQAAAHSRR